MVVVLVLALSSCYELKHHRIYNLDSKKWAHTHLHRTHKKQYKRLCALIQCAMQKRDEKESESDKWKSSYHCRKLRRNAIKFTFLLGSLLLLWFHYAYIAKQQRIISHFFSQTFAHRTWQTAWERKRGVDIHERITRVMKKEINTKSTTTAANVVKTCVILCWCSTTSKAPKMVFDDTFFHPSNILT